MNTAEFKSWSDFWFFCQKTKKTFRYVHDKDVRHFLRVVNATSQRRGMQLERGTKLCRAQLGCDVQKFTFEGQIREGNLAPFRPERMKPLQDRAKEGRANSKGISAASRHAQSGHGERIAACPLSESPRRLSVSVVPTSTSGCGPPSGRHNHALSYLVGYIAALDVEDGDGLVTAPQAGYEPKSNPESA